MDDYILIGVCCTSYYNIPNMTKIFTWARLNYRNFNVFIMNNVSKYNYLAQGMSLKTSIQKSNKTDRQLYNRVLQSLINSGFLAFEANNLIIKLSDLQKTNQYIEIYEKIIDLYDNNLSFKNDCIEIIKNLHHNIDIDNIQIAMKFLFAELPIWLNAPKILNVPNTTLLYTNLNSPWRRILYNYNLIDTNIKILLRSEF